MENNEQFDICVIGAGPGGYVAAIHAGRTGAKVALVEKDYFGGTCLNVGCIPTKTLIASTEALHTAKHAGDFGIKIEGSIEADWEAIQGRKDNIVTRLRGGIGNLLKNANVEVIRGTAEFTSDSSIKVTYEQNEINLNSKKFIIATGSKPAIPGFIPRSSRVIDSTDLLAIQEIPKSLLVLGGGVIGCEFASLFAELGTQVTIVEMLPNILPEQDIDVSKQITREFKKRKVKIITGNALQDIKADESGVSGIAGKKAVSADYMLVSIGRSAMTDGLKPEEAGITVNERGFIPVNNKCETNIPNIYAIGDISGGIQLAHWASAMGLCAADNALGIETEYDDSLVPGCIFTAPEIGCVGVTQQYCEKNEIPIKVGKFPFSALGKAMAINEIAGFCKIIASAEDDRILGVHIIGPHATDLISEAVTAMSLGATAEEVGNAVHAHPTLGESMMEAAHAVHEKCIHMPVIKKN